MVNTTSSKSIYNESVKVIVVPDDGYKLSYAQVMDGDTQHVELQAKSKAPYTPKSYNFFMPNSDVSVHVQFDKVRH